MKNFVILAAIILTSLSFGASATTADANPDYVVTKEGVLYFENVKFGADTGYLICENVKGDILKIKRAEIVAFRRNGAVFERLPLIDKDKVCSKCDFMEVYEREGYTTVYRYMKKDEKGQYHAQYIVYRNGSFVITISEQNIKTFIELLHRI